MMKIAGGLFWMLAAALLLGAGRVQTRDGKVVEGEVSFGEGVVIVKTAAGEASFPIDQIEKMERQVVPIPKAVMGASDGALPSGWKNGDIGAVYKPGSAKCDDKGVFSLNASGWGAWGAKDSLHYAWRELAGDGQIMAHVAKLDDSAGPVVAGVMMRQSLSPDSPMAAACVYPSGEVRMTRRPISPAQDFKRAEDVPGAKGWVRLIRRGEMVTSFQSMDGKFWERIESKKIPMGETILVGVGAWATGNAWMGGATIDSVMVVEGTPAGSYFPGQDPLLAGIVFKNGDMLACQPIGLNATVVRYIRDDKGFTTPREGIARLVFNPIPPDAGAPGSKRGLILTNGDFFDGEVEGMDFETVVWGRPQRVRAAVRSVLFGTRKFDAESEVIAIELAEVSLAPATYEVRMDDGSLQRAKQIKVGKSGVEVDGVARPVAGWKRL